ncbi:hypothetical protein SAMN05421812_113153 [Asanoa hainanensis]|uniref:Uncharacterized protein n=1 Tax=Asanoa hainanensis TaxID=560556 RepID=A0A239P3G9_9ACTN|nr:hypothetical protein [Asanoa hainanensis]SNT61636.1 hypothetical protein SAMN05421812_113153 [Asanoa hainanensis]
MRKITKRAGVIIGVAALGISGGVAWAVWSITGTATATATAATAQTITVTGEAYNLVPGGAKDLLVKSNNPNDFPVQITSWGSPTIVSDKANCAGSNVSFTPPTNPVILQKGYHEQTVVNGAQMALSTPDACQGATFTLTTTVSGLSTQP